MLTEAAKGAGVRRFSIQHCSQYDASMDEAVKADAKRLVEAAQPVGYQNVYVLSSAGRGPSNIASQQRRALNLAWALEAASAAASLKGKVAWVFGAGAAGLTCAAALKHLGCEVQIFDRTGEAMPFQKGCHHRFLHPRIVEWPNRRSTMSSANLPLLNWYAETADNVRKQILAGYHGRGLPEIRRISRFDVLPQGAVVVHDADDIGPELAPPDFVILALGFGVERTEANIPRLSYWRLDALDQPPLITFDDPCTFLVCGDGDGATIDFLRASLTSFDHGPFLNHACELLEPLRPAIEQIEVAVRAAARRMRGPQRRLPRAQQDALSLWLREEYDALGNSANFDELEAFLGQEQRKRVRVQWAGLSPTSTPFNTQPLHRLLAWRMLKRAPESFSYVQRKLERATLLDQRRNSGPLYEVVLSDPADSTAQEIAKCHVFVYRCGPENSLERDLPAVHAALERREPVELLDDERLREHANKRFATPAGARGAGPAGSAKAGERAEPQGLGPKNAQDALGNVRVCVELVSRVERRVLRTKSRKVRTALYELRLFLNVVGQVPSLEAVCYVRYADPERSPIRNRVVRGFKEGTPFSLKLFTWADYEVAVEIETPHGRIELPPTLLTALEWVPQGGVADAMEMLTGVRHAIEAERLLAKANAAAAGAAEEDAGGERAGGENAAEENAAEQDAVRQNDEGLLASLRAHAHRGGAFDDLKLLKERNLEAGLVRSIFKPCAQALIEAWVVPEAPKLHVLDAGCGSGIVARCVHERWAKHPEFPPLQIQAFDSIAEPIAVAKEAAANEWCDWDDRVQLEFSVATFETFDARPATYDVIFAQHVIQHLGKATQASLALCFEWLKPGGQLIVSVWDSACEVYEWLYKSCGQSEKYEKIGMADDELVGALVAAGFPKAEPRAVRMKIPVQSQRELLADYMKGSQVWLERGRLAQRRVLAKVEEAEREFEIGIKIAICAKPAAPQAGQP